MGHSASGVSPAPRAMVMRAASCMNEREAVPLFAADIFQGFLDLGDVQ